MLRGERLALAGARCIASSYSSVTMQSLKHDVMDRTHFVDFVDSAHTLTAVDLDSFGRACKAPPPPGVIFDREMPLQLSVLSFFQERTLSRLHWGL